MADLPRDPDTSGDTGDADAEIGPGRVSGPGTPGWVKAFGIIAIALIIVVIAVQLLFGVQHGPGLHAPSG
ncbi:MAG TPA: hypothetical protein VGB34_06735 [Candidatus Limnocylindria bacterium]